MIFSESQAELFFKMAQNPFEIRILALILMNTNNGPKILALVGWKRGATVYPILLLE
jgi:hypothetical protein